LAGGADAASPVTPGAAGGLCHVRFTTASAVMRGLPR
jgi:hypothetical protein